MCPDQTAVADFVRGRLDDGNAVGTEIGYDQFSSIRFEREIGRGAAYLEQGKNCIAGQIDRGYLRGPSACYEGFA